MSVSPDDDVRGPLVLQVVQLRRRIAWLEGRLREQDPEALSDLPEPEGKPGAGRDVDPSTLVDTYGDAAGDVMQALLEHVRTDARLDAVAEFATEQAEALDELRADERTLAAVAATLEEVRRAARRPGHSPAVVEALEWSVTRFERAMIGAGPVLEETLAAERDRTLTAAVEHLGLDGLEAATWVAEVNARLGAAPVDPRSSSDAGS